MDEVKKLIKENEYLKRRISSLEKTIRSTKKAIKKTRRLVEQAMGEDNDKYDLQNVSSQLDDANNAIDKDTQEMINLKYDVDTSEYFTLNTPNGPKLIKKQYRITKGTNKCS